MKPLYKIFRGDSLLGYVGKDDDWPGEPFKPADAFHDVEWLFAKEHEVAMRMADLEEADGDDEAIAAVQEELDALQEQILSPGVRFESMDGASSFECLDLNVYEGRVCWR